MVNLNLILGKCLDVSLKHAYIYDLSKVIGYKHAGWYVVVVGLPVSSFK